MGSGSSGGTDLGSRLKDALLWVGALVLVISLVATLRLDRSEVLYGIGFFPLGILAFALRWFVGRFFAKTRSELTSRVGGD